MSSDIYFHESILYIDKYFKFFIVSQKKLLFYKYDDFGTVFHTFIRRHKIIVPYQKILQIINITKNFLLFFK